MGLDTVELIARVETDFGVSIPDEVASTLTTPREVVDYLMTQPLIASKKSRETVALELWFLLEDQLSIERFRHNENSRFVEDMGID